ncbi:hypothetical protein CRUP_018749 [Coryphaenoides rupestris]|nr:hypothetical protein CRUP_018749 [Coryphaenoides rupestris]
MHSWNASNCSVPLSGYQYHLFPLVYGVAFTLGLPGNLLALFIFLFKERLRTSSGVYVVNLALADTGSLLTLPFRIHYHLHGNHWAFGDMACRVTGVLWHANVYISICFMTCICVDRYVAVMHPHRYLRLKNPRYAMVISGFLWAVLAVAILTFLLMGPLESDVGNTAAGSCFENFARYEWERRMAAYSVVSLIFCSLLPSGIILVCYPLAMRRISRIGGRTSRRAQWIILTVLAITLLCFLPYHLVHLLHLLRRLGIIRDCGLADDIYHARRVTTALVSLNTCLDPLLYYATSPHSSRLWLPLRRLWLWGRPRRALQDRSSTLVLGSSAEEDTLTTMDSTMTDMLSGRCCVVCVDAVQGVGVAVRVLELHTACEPQVVFAEAQLLQGLLRGHQPQILQGEGRVGEERGDGRGRWNSILAASPCTSNMLRGSAMRISCMMPLASAILCPIALERKYPGQ